MKLTTLQPKVREISLSRLAGPSMFVDARPAWHNNDNKRTLTGRPWRRTRERILQRDCYLCQECLKADRTTEAKEVDHILPLAKGGTDDDDNLQSLCRTCHQIKTILETSGAAQTHPNWLPPPACGVILVTGPAGGGKTTYCRDNAAHSDKVIDLDDCYFDVCGVHGHAADRAHLTNALRWRNKQLAELALQRSGHAFVIVSSPTTDETKWWQDTLGAKVVTCDPGYDEVMMRLAHDQRRKEAACKWYEERKRNVWKS